ncbi:hypothetical protein KP509_30G029200 [Ceratopteris richardii]|uniref:Pentatricopeptide repeat-containing protein n=1 Tax=Ceratopteris richardii TaxID=49495 RepID=A0A8T2R1W4_CERRI|nr:hypothetical protein KP509_30G029200 [Ceratopteris richardii]
MASTSAFMSSLRTCAKKKDLYECNRLRAEAHRTGLFEASTYVGNMIITIYGQCGAVSEAREVFGALPVRDLVSWNALVSAYARNGQAQEALDCYEQMRSGGFIPDVITYTCILKACGIVGSFEWGITIHEDIAGQGFLGKDIMLDTALIDMYAKCGALVRAQQLFEGLSTQDLVSWSALIAGYVQHGRGEAALHCYSRMRQSGHSPDAITYVCILKACSITGAVDMGMQIHDEVVIKGLLGKIVALDTALVDMYAHCGVLKKAREVFDKLKVRDVVAWSSFITGLSQEGQTNDAMECFIRMRAEGHYPDDITYTSILKACSNIGAVDLGKQIHIEIISQRLLEKNIVLGNSLIDMYAKCGVPMKAQQVFDEFPEKTMISWSILVTGYAQQGQVKTASKCFLEMCNKGLAPNIICWNALIGGYTQQGQIEKALHCCQSMQEEGISPDNVTFVCLLHACSHLGLVDEGQIIFGAMEEIYGMTPSVEHFTCLTDLFGRSGLIDKANSVINKMPFSDSSRVWCALLGACQKTGDAKLGSVAFGHAVNFDEFDGVTYICMQNLCLSANLQVSEFSTLNFI